MNSDRTPRRRVPPLFNDMFLYLFGREESKPLTLSLLNAILDVAGLPAVEEIDQISADSAQPGGVKCRTARCDVIVVSGDAIYDIEAHGWDADPTNKMLFYASKLISTRTPKGERGDDYSTVPPVVVITLLHNRILFPASNQFVTVGRVSWDVDGKWEVATDRTTYVVIEMDKIAARYNLADGEVMSDESTAWLYLLAKGYKKQEEMDAMAGRFAAILEFAKEYGIAIDDPDLERQYDVYESSLLEHNMIVNEARRKGMREGLEQGLEQGKKEGLEQGKKEGLEQGKKEGLEQGKKEGLEQGKKEGLEQGKIEGLEQGKKEGFELGKKDGFELGVAEGIEAGKKEVREQAYKEADEKARGEIQSTRERMAESLRKAGVGEDVIQEAIKAAM